MEKVKFYIKGMQCTSCATLIEKKLKDYSGVIGAKVDYNSKKAVIVYDEHKITETEIQNLIEKIGDYKVEKIKDTENNDTENNDNNDEKPNLSLSYPRVLSSLKTITGLMIVSLGLNAFLAFAIFKELPKNDSQQKASVENNSPPIEDSNSDPNANANPTNPSVATFTITEKDHIRGDFNAPITLVEFSDFECPFCVRHYPTLNKILNDYKGKVRLVYKHFPLSFHPNGQKAAEASECAGEQNYFWEYHDKLFENQPSGYSLEKFKQWAVELGLNGKKFNECLDSGRYADKVKSDSQEGIQKGVNGTPMTFINGQLVGGALPYETFKQVLDNLLSTL